MTEQPFVDEEGNILLWNGEVFSGLPGHSVGSSDTAAVARLLRDTCRQDGIGLTGQSVSTGEQIARALSCINGPFAFAYFRAAEGAVYFGRDSFGRRSLLCLADAAGDLHAIASVSCEAAQHDGPLRWSELPVDGVYRAQPQPLGGARFGRSAPWPADRITLGRPLCDDVATEQCRAASASRKFLQALQDAVRQRVLSLFGARTCEGEGDSPRCRIGVLFSGGIDSVLLAAVLHSCLADAHEPVELVNVSFSEQSGPSADRLAAVAALLELQVTGRF